MKSILRNFYNTLRRFKLASFLNIMGLCVAYAAFLVIMMQVDYEREFDRCHPTADRVCRIERVTEEGNGYNTVIPRAFANAVGSSSPHVEATALNTLDWKQTYLTVGEGNDRQGFREFISPCYLDFVKVFGIPILEGDADCLKDPEKLMIPRSMARRMFGNRSAIGQQIHAEEKIWMKGDLRTFTVGAVYEDFPENTQLNNNIYTAMNNEQENDWHSQSFVGYVLLDKPESRKLVEDNFNQTFDFVAGGMTEKGRLDLTPLTDIYYMPDQINGIAKSGNPDTIRLLILIALLVIGVAGINFTNFSTSLAPMRIKSLNTQKVLGSSVSLLRWGLVIEAVGISLIACLLSILLVMGLDHLKLLSFVTADMDLSRHLPLLALLAGVAFGVGLLAGVYPARYMTSFPPALVLKGGFGLSQSGRKLRTALIGVQYVVSIGLIVGAFFIQCQNSYMRSYNLGFDKDQIAIVDLGIISRDTRNTYVNKLKEYAGIEDVAFSNSMVGGADSYTMYPQTYNDEQFFTYIISVSWNFPRVMGIPVTAGRDFTEADAQAESTSTYLYGRAISEKMRMKPETYMADNWEGKNYIAGLMGDVRVLSLRAGDDNDVAFQVNRRKPLPISYIRLRAGVNVDEAVEHIRETVASIDPTYPFEIKFYDTVFDQLYQKEEYMRKMILLFSLLAIVLSVVGVFGLVIFETQYRRKEIGLRKVHGAAVGEILMMFNKIYLRIVVVCFVIAAPLAFYGVHKWLENFARRTPIHWWVFALAFLLVTLITMATVTFQNWRAANENPVNSIKSE